MDKKILIGVPHNTAIDPEAQVSIFNLCSYLHSKGWEVNPRYSEGTYLSTQRNELAYMAKQNGEDILFIDSDMVFRPEDVEYLLDAANEENSEIDVIGGLYYSRREPYFPICLRLFSEKELLERSKFDDRIEPKDCEYFFKMDLHSIPTDAPFYDENGLGIGTGFLYIKHKILEKMWSKQNVRKYGKPFNYFQMKNGEEIKEDLAFCLRCRRENIKVWCDPRPNLIHLGKMKVTRATCIDYAYRDQLYGNDIDGWMSFNELNWLYHNIKKKGIKDIIEIGSYKGRSTHALLSATTGIVYAIDTWKSSPEILAMYKRNNWKYDENLIFQEFITNVGKFNNLRIIKNDSKEVAKTFDPVDMVFVDGSHIYEDVKSDLLNYDKLAKRLICGHDWNRFEGVNKAVEEIFGKGVKTYESLWFVWKDK